MALCVREWGAHRRQDGNAVQRRHVVQHPGDNGGLTAVTGSHVHPGPVQLRRRRCRGTGRGDGSFASWRRRHRAPLQRHSRRLVNDGDDVTAIGPRLLRRGGRLHDGAPRPRRQTGETGFRQDICCARLQTATPGAQVPPSCPMRRPKKALRKSTFSVRYNDRLRLNGVVQ